MKIAPPDVPCADWSADEIAANPFPFRNRRARELWNNGRSVDSIAMTLDIGIAYVRQILLDQGILAADVGRRSTPDAPLPTVNLFLGAKTSTDQEAHITGQAEIANRTFMRRILREHIRTNTMCYGFSKERFLATCAHFDVAVPIAVR